MRAVWGGKKAGTFRQFLKNLDLLPKRKAPSSQQINAEKRRAYANTERVRQAFRRPRTR